MKGKQTFILLLIVTALGGAWYFLSKGAQDSWSGSAASGGKVIDFPVNDVARVAIKQGDSEVNLVRKNEIWTVQERADYPANFELVGGLLRKLWELKTVQEVKVGPSQLPRLELVEPGKGDNAGTLVRMSAADGKPINALLIGKKYLRKMEGGGVDFGGGGDGFPAGRYVKPVSDAKVSLVSVTLDEVDPKPEHWISKEFIKVETPKSVSVSGASETQRWSLTRESASAEWKLADAKPDEKADSSKTSPLNSVLSSPSPVDVLATDAKLEDPITNATIETIDGFRYELKIGKANDDNHPVSVKVTATLPKERTPGKDEKPEDKTRLDGEFAIKQKQFQEKLAKEQKFQDRIYLLPKYTVEALLKERSALLAEKPAETPKPADAPTPAAAPVSPSTPKPASSVPAPSPATPTPKTEAASAPVSAPTAPQSTAPPAPATPATSPKPATPTPTPAPATPTPSAATASAPEAATKP